MPTQACRARQAVVCGGYLEEEGTPHGLSQGGFMFEVLP